MRNWHRSIVWLAASLTVLPLAVLGGCTGEQEEPSPVVARVGDAYLTLNEARSYIDTTRGSVTDQLSRYISHWVSTELLYQEAKRRGVEATEQFAQQLQAVRKQLATQVLLDLDVYADSSFIDESSLRNYFAQHAEEFTTKEDMVKLVFIAFNSREKASQFAAVVSRGTPWATAVQNFLRDPATAGSILYTTSERYYTQQTLHPPELWKVGTSLDVNDVSFPVRSSVGYFIVQSLRRIKQGSAAEYEIVRDEVRQRLMIEERRRRYEELLGNLRKRYNVQVLLGSHPGKDSVRYHE